METKTKIVKKKMKDLHMADYNPRTITEEAFQGLGQSLERFGVLAYIVWNKRSKNIVGGHQRYKQLLEHGILETDVIEVDLDTNEEITLNIALNSGSIKGDFTPGAIEALRMTEARIGQVFTDIKLDELLTELENKNKKKEKKKKKDVEQYQDAESLDMVFVQAESLITCPKCGSKWKMNDKTVVENNFKPEEIKDAQS